MYSKHIQVSKSPATNAGFASGGVTSKLGDLYFNSSSVFVDCKVLRIHHLRVSAKH